MAFISSCIFELLLTSLLISSSRPDWLILISEFESASDCKSFWAIFAACGGLIGEASLIDSLDWVMSLLDSSSESSKSELVFS